MGKKIGSSLKQGAILALTGNLGAGKTTFIQGLAKGLGIKNRITSPTFILMRKYKQSLAGMASNNFYHVDLYRLEGNLEDEVRDLGLTDVWGRKDNIVAIEWAEKIKDILPKGTIWISFQNLDENLRKIIIDGL